MNRTLQVGDIVRRSKAYSSSDNKEEGIITREFSSDRFYVNWSNRYETHIEKKDLRLVKRPNNEPMDIPF